MRAGLYQGKKNLIHLCDFYDIVYSRFGMIPVHYRIVADKQALRHNRATHYLDKKPSCR